MHTRCAQFSSQVTSAGQFGRVASQTGVSAGGGTEGIGNRAVFFVPRAARHQFDQRKLPPVGEPAARPESFAAGAARERDGISGKAEDVMKRGDCASSWEDPEETLQRAEGGGVSRAGMALTAVCFFSAVVWAIAAGAGARLAARLKCVRPCKKADKTPLIFPKSASSSADARTLWRDGRRQLREKI